MKIACSEGSRLPGIRSRSRRHAFYFLPPEPAPSRRAALAATLSATASNQAVGASPSFRSVAPIRKPRAGAFRLPERIAQQAQTMGIFAFSFACSATVRRRQRRALTMATDP